MHAVRGLRRKTVERQSGFTLIEMMVSFSALLIVLLGFSRMILSARMASRTSHEATLAKEAARAMLETLRGERLDQVYFRYNGNANDDPGLAGSAPGAGFAVPGLDAPPGDADGLPGLILFPEMGGQLREDLVLPQLFGSIDDLDGDGNTDSANHADDYHILPVVVRVEWRSSGGTGRIEFRSVLARY